VATVTATPTPVGTAVDDHTVHVAWDGAGSSADGTRSNGSGTGRVADDGDRRPGHETGLAGDDGETTAPDDAGAWRLTYEVVVPEDAADGADLRLDGDLRTADESVAVEGDAGIAVAVDPLERVRDGGTATERDLREAHERYEAGRLTDDELARVHAAWLGTDGTVPATVESAEDD